MKENSSPLHFHPNSSHNSQQFIKTPIILFLFVVSVILYIISLRGCQGTQTYCLVTLDPSFFYFLGVYLIFCTLIMDLFIIFLIKGKMNVLHFTYIIPTYVYLLYFYDKGSDLTHHGSYNKMLFYFFMVLLFILIGFVILIQKLISNKYYKLLLITSILIGYLSFSIKQKVHNGCSNWEYGINGVKVENDPTKDKCYIVKPQKCWINMIDGYLDVSRIISETCDNFRKGERDELVKYLPERLKDTYNFGYPITTNYTWLNESHFDRFFNNVMNNMVDLDKNKKSDSEILLKFDPATQLGKIEIKIQKNETLIKERENIYNSLKPEERPKFNNFLFVYIDALSRPHFNRKMKHTISFLEKYFKKQDTSMDAFQFMKYHAFIYYTPPNISPMFYGESMFNSNGTNLIRGMKERGFITAHSNNICSREMYDLEDLYTENLDFEDFDHENVAMFCDPNFHNYENPFTPYLGPYSIKRRCLYGKDTFDHVLDYGEEFWKTYKDQRKFLRVAFQDAHEGTGEVVSYLDKRLGKFLNNFYEKGYLDDTVVFFISDHGNNMIGVYNIFQVEDFVMEKTLASWFALFPKKSITEEERRSIEYNQQIMVTPYDIHETMLDMFGFKTANKYSSRFGKTVLKRINGLERNCETYEQDLLDEWCRCIDYEK